MLSLLKQLVSQSPDWVEIRYHKRDQLRVHIRSGELSRADSRILAGAGIRVLVDGSWGFVSTSDLTPDGLQSALSEATAAARLAAKQKKTKVQHLPTGQIAKGTFNSVPNPTEPSLKEKIDTMLEMEQAMRNYSPQVEASWVEHNRMADHKLIVNSDGAEADIFDIKQDIALSCIMSKDGQRETGDKSLAVTGTWYDLFAETSWQEMVKEAAEIAEAKLGAEYVQGGEYTVILDPQLVGILAHEAIGHTVEADFVLGGSIANGKIGQKVASELITLVDEGNIPGKGGTLLVDDEGTVTQRSVIIDRGILTEYMHNRETAGIFDVEPKGNARAYTYQDEPLVRMTNTYILPGADTLDEMIAGVKEGYFLRRFFGGGQADSTAEFQLGVNYGYEIKDGKLGKLVKGITISGQAFNVLNSVDAVSKDCKIGIGRGTCGKWQAAKTDGGGPYIRCRITIGGKQ